jgi:hypothetical protein
VFCILFFECVLCFEEVFSLVNVYEKCDFVFEKIEDFLKTLTSMAKTYRGKNRKTEKEDFYKFGTVIFTPRNKFQSSSAILHLVGNGLKL